MKLTTVKIKEQISIWLKNNKQFEDCFINYFGSIGPDQNEIKECCRKFKCEPNEIAIKSAIINYVSNGLNWKRYEKCKFSLDEYNEDDNGQEELVGWKSEKFDPKCENYIVRRFESRYSGFDDKIFRVISDKNDTEILSWGLFDS